MSHRVTTKSKPTSMKCSLVKWQVSDNSEFIMNPRAAIFYPKISQNQPNQLENAFNENKMCSPEDDMPLDNKFTLNPLAKTFTNVDNINCLEKNIECTLQFSETNLNDNSLIYANTYTPPNAALCDTVEIIKNIRIENLNRLIIGQLNINSIRNKFDSLQEIIIGHIDILVITESKLDISFPLNQFDIDGFTQYRSDKNANSGGVIIYVRDDIACREIKDHILEKDTEGIFLEINLRKNKWLIFGGYNNKKSNIGVYLENLGKTLDTYISKFENLLLLGDFNSEIKEESMSSFCETYNSKYCKRNDLFQKTRKSQSTRSDPN